MFMILRNILQIFLAGVFLFGFPLSQSISAAQIRLAWDPNTERDLAGYKVYYGISPWSFGDPIKLRKSTTYTLTGLTQGQTYHIVITTYDRTKLESTFSNQVSGIAHDELYGKWVFDISGRDKGGAVLRFEDSQNTFMGYGITNNLNFFWIEGIYNIGEDKIINGTYKIYDLNNIESILSNGNVYGKIDRKGTKVTLILDDLSLEMKGSLFIEDPYKPLYPDIPEDWTIHISGRIKGDISLLKIEPYPISGEKNSHLFKFSGSEAIANLGSIVLLGVLILSSKKNIYGIYDICGAISDKGFFSGSMNHDLSKFSVRTISDNGNGYTFTGMAQP